MCIKWGYTSFLDIPKCLDIEFLVHIKSCLGIFAVFSSKSESILEGFSECERYPNECISKWNTKKLGFSHRRHAICEAPPTEPMLVQR